MLVLSRKPQESIMIDDDVEVVVIDIKKGKVRLGINASKDRKVDRREVYDAKKKRA